MNHATLRERKMREASAFLQAKLHAAGAEVRTEERDSEIWIHCFLPATGDCTLVRVVWDEAHREARFEHQMQYELAANA